MQPLWVHLAFRRGWVAELSLGLPDTGPLLGEALRHCCQPLFQQRLLLGQKWQPETPDPRELLVGVWHVLTDVHPATDLHRSRPRQLIKTARANSMSQEL